MPKKKPKTEAAETLFLIDAYSLIFQVYYAIRQPMTGTRGQPTNAVFGFTGDVRHLLNDVGATHLVCCMDAPATEEAPHARVEMYEEYKAQREEMPTDLVPQIPMILDVVEGYRIPIVQCPGWEADDVIATLAKRGTDAGLDVRIVSSDKDCRQLLGPRVSMYNIRKKQYFGPDELLEDWGVTPDRVIDFQALVGDSVDNVPGVPLVGPKKAQTLLETFGTLDEVLAHADEAPGKKLRENLVTFADQARLSRELVTLRTDLPLEFDLDEAKVVEPNHDRLFELFTDFGFRRYADEASKQALEAKVTDDHEREWHCLRTAEQFESFLADLKEQPRICVDLETTNQDAMRADIVGWAICWEPNVAWYLPVDGPGGEETLDGETVLAALKPVLEDPDVQIDNQNVKYDLLVLRRHGVEATGVGVDPMIADYLLDAGALQHGLEKLAKQYLLRKTIPISDLIGKGKKQKTMFDVDVDRVAEYATEDADVALQVAVKLEAELKKQELWDLYWDLERPLIPVLVDVEFAGVRVDVEELGRQSEGLAERLDTLLDEIHELAGHAFNPDSPKQLATVLFEELKLPSKKRTKTGFSTDADVLEQLAAQHPLPAKVIEHRQLTKLRGTYLEALPKMVNPHTGNVHASFNQAAAATGRLSSSDPNLQNIPIRTEEGRQIRKAFIASREGWKLVSLDYSQIELRVLAHFCEDEVLLQAFANGVDVHRAVAAEIFSVKPEDVDADQRRIAKAVNFGVIYGQTPWGLAAALRIPKEEAEAFIDDYFERHSAVDAFVADVLAECSATGYATTILGRRREIVGIRGKRRKILNMSERTAVNTVVQGSAADLIKRAMINVHARLKSDGHPARMLLQIHDELVFETPAEAADDLVALVRQEMTGAMELRVPLVVDAGVGDNWFEAH